MFCLLEACDFFLFKATPRDQRHMHRNGIFQHDISHTQESFNIALNRDHEGMNLDSAALSI